MKVDTIDKIISLKADGYKSLYLIQVEGLDFIVRPLTFDEYNTVISLEKYLDGVTINDTLIRIATLYNDAPRGLDYYLSHSKAIHADHIAEHILVLSGFQNAETFLKVLEEKRQVAQQAQTIIEIYICTAFRAYTPSDVQKMTLEEQIELFAKAEEALGKPIDFGKLINPEVYPVAPGMSSTDDITDMMSADQIDWDEIGKI